jgi:hypothetical protein
MFIADKTHNNLQVIKKNTKLIEDITIKFHLWEVFFFFDETIYEKLGTELI